MSAARQLLRARTRKLTPVEVPEWGGVVYVQSLSVAQTLEYLAIPEGRRGLDSFPLLVRMGAVDEAGAPLFERAEDVGDVEIDVVSRLATAIIRASKLGKEFQEDEEKNS